MANIQSAKKRIRQNKKRAERNRVYRSSARTYIKKARKYIDAGQLEEAQEQANQAYVVLDKAARKRIIHPRNAARRKGRLMAALAAAQKQANQ
ncbi:MAG TPA: 30S ribosomal protein S20 [Chloroflexi bacterium]|nr:30S ribosomal protein S20 [Chloroflexota bacterium]